MYDVDGNGVIDQDEMTKIVQVDKYFKHWNLLLFSIRRCFSENIVFKQNMTYK